MEETLYVDLWSDIVCPFCYLGDRQLRRAVEDFEHADQVVVRRHAFELDPRSPINSGLTLDEVLARKYSMSLEQARTINLRMEESARALELKWSLAAARPTNTFDGHRVIALAQTQGLDGAMSDRLFAAYFSEGELVSDHATLERLALEVGVAGAGDLWGNEVFVEEVRGDEAAAEELGISGVPSFVVDGKFMVVGAQGSDHLLSVLRRAWARRAGQSSDSAGTTAAVATE